MFSKKLRHTIAFTLFLILGLFAGRVGAQTDIYVDAVAGGNLTGDGSAENPYKTITVALAFSARDNLPGPWHVHIRPGTYDADPAKAPSDRELFPIRLQDGMILAGTTSAEECIIDAQHVGETVVPIIDSRNLG